MGNCGLCRGKSEYVTAKITQSATKMQIDFVVVSVFGAPLLYSWLDTRSRPPFRRKRSVLVYSP